MPKVKLEKGLSKPTVRKRLKSDPGTPQNIVQVKHCKKEGNLNQALTNPEKLVANPLNTNI